MHAGRKMRERDGADGNAPELEHGMPRGAEHAPQLAVAPLAQGDFEPRVLLLPKAAYAAGPQADAVETDAAPQAGERFLAGLALHLHVIDFLDPVPGVHERLGELAVVREKKRPFARKVEPSYGIHALLDALEEIPNAGPPLRDV